MTVYPSYHSLSSVTVNKCVLAELKRIIEDSDIVKYVCCVDSAAKAVFPPIAAAGWLAVWLTMVDPCLCRVLIHPGRVMRAGQSQTMSAARSWKLCVEATTFRSLYVWGGASR